jgi:hypothetical protein
MYQSHPVHNKTHGKHVESLTGPRHVEVCIYILLLTSDEISKKVKVSKTSNKCILQPLPKRRT